LHSIISLSQIINALLGAMTEINLYVIITT